MVYLEVHSSSIMSVLQSRPGSFLLLVKDLLEYQDYAPNGSICGSKWNMFNHVHTGSGFMQVQVFFFWLQSSFSWPSPWQYFEYRDQVPSAARMYRLTGSWAGKTWRWNCENFLTPVRMPSTNSPWGTWWHHCGHRSRPLIGWWLLGLPGLVRNHDHPSRQHTWTNQNLDISTSWDMRMKYQRPSSTSTI